MKRSLDEPAFLESIRENPLEDTPRLVYADWLEEQLDFARADFIRIQCRLARTSPGDTVREELQRQERELWFANQFQWKAESNLPTNLTTGVFDRGFPHPRHVELDAQMLLGMPDTVWRMAPLWGISFLPRPVDILPHVAAMKELSQISELEIYPITEEIEPRLILPILTSPHLKNLRTLQLNGIRCQPEHLRVAIESGNLRNCMRLRISAMPLGELGCSWIANSKDLLELESLELSACQIGDEGCRTLAQANNLPSLSRLRLPQNQIGRDGAKHLTRSGWFHQLNVLELYYNHLGDTGAGILANEVGVKNLSHLDLGINWIGTAGADSLVNSTNFENLWTLYLGGNRFSDNLEMRDQLKKRFGSRVVI
jgi:uncharacterized protein (TIGR02996 family)